MSSVNVNMRNDAILMEILKERKTIAGFLDAVFGFLRRNTDFYHVKKHENEGIGFPKGIHEQLIFGAMQRYNPEHTINQLVTEDTGEDVPHAVDEVEIETILDIKKDQEPNNKEEHSKTNTDSSNENVTFERMDYKNGNCFNNYCWSQTLGDIELQIELPSKLRCSRSLEIFIQASKIIIRGKSQPPHIVLEGELSHKCKHNDAVWTISEGKLILSIDKIKEIWWDKLFVNEPAIDVTKIDCERYIDELPEESQAAIEKLRAQQLYEENESNTLEKLRKSWDTEGSPFRGQPFNPSVVKFN